MSCQEQHQVGAEQVSQTKANFSREMYIRSKMGRATVPVTIGRNPITLRIDAPDEVEIRAPAGVRVVALDGRDPEGAELADLVFEEHVDRVLLLLIQGEEW